MNNVLVTGCARSGLTLMMNLLYKNNIPCYAKPPAFEGYRIGRIPYQKLQNTAIKLIDPQMLKTYPPNSNNTVILMNRNKKQQALSTFKLLAIVTNTDHTKANFKKILSSLKKDQKLMKVWAKTQSKYIIINFETLINFPKRTLIKLSKFLNMQLDYNTSEIVIQRSPKCYPTMLEMEIYQ